MTKKFFSSFLAIGLFCFVLGFMPKTIAAETTTNASVVSDVFTLENTEAESVGGSFSNDLFSIKTQVVSNLGQTDGGRINYFDFKETFTATTSSQRILKRAVLYYDYMYYDVSYWGSNHMSTPMLWDNNSHSFVLPNPWVVNDTTTVDTSLSLSSVNNEGVKVFVTDLNSGTSNISDLNYLRKGDFTSIASQTSEDVADINGIGYALKEPSVIPLDAELPAIEYTVDPSLINSPLVKTLRVNQEK